MSHERRLQAWETNRRLKARNRRLKRNLETLQSEMRHFEEHIKSLNVQQTALRKLLVAEAYREQNMKQESRLIRTRLRARELQIHLINKTKS